MWEKKAMNPKSKITNERGFIANINEITQRHFNWATLHI